MDKATDFQAFVQLWCATLELYDREPSEDAAMLAFNALSAYPIDVVRQGLQDHMRDPKEGKYPPKPGHIIAQIDRRDPNRWPSADEAWAALPKTEADTAIMCDEMQKAAALCAELIDSGDQVAARRSFIDAYQREVDQAQLDGRRPRWYISPGSDPEKRQAAVMDAYHNQRLTYDQAKPHLAHLSDDEIQAGRSTEGNGQELLEQAKARANGGGGKSSKSKTRAKQALNQMRELLGETNA